MIDKDTEFTYAIGRPWDLKDPAGSIGFYAYGKEIFHGTMANAIVFRDYCNRQLDDDTRGGYRIYQITEVPGSEHFPAHVADSENADSNSEKI